MPAKSSQEKLEEAMASELRKKEKNLSPEGLYFFKPALHIDNAKGIIYVSVPVAFPQIVKGKPQLNTQVMVVSKNDTFILDQESIEERKVFPTTIPDLQLPERWSSKDINSFISSVGSVDSGVSVLIDRQQFIQPQESKISDIFGSIKIVCESLFDFQDLHYYTFLTLWIMMTYFTPIFYAVPFIFLSGTRGSGKTKIMEFLQQLCFNSESTVNTTPSALFRIIEKNQCAVMVDEAESLTGLETNPDIRLLLNACYKSTGTVTRTNKDTHNVERFHVFAPVAIGAINELEPTLLSRCITLVTIRTASDKGRRVPSDKYADWQEIRNSLYRMIFKYAEKVEDTYEKNDYQNLNCRNLEIWKPILAIASVLSEESGDESIFQSMKEMAEQITEETETLTTLEEYVLRAVNDVCLIDDTYEVKAIRSRVAELNTIDGEMINLEKTRGRTLGSILKKFGFRPAGRSNKSSRYRIMPDKIKDLFVRYSLSLYPAAQSSLDTQSTPFEANENDENMGSVDDSVESETLL